MEAKEALFIFIGICLVIGIVWFLIELCTYYRGKGWHDCLKAHKQAYYNSEVPYYVPEMEDIYQEAKEKYHDTLEKLAKTPEENKYK